MNNMVINKFLNKNLLIIGETGSGRSKFVDYFITSLVTKFSSNELKLVLIDPRQVQLSAYQYLPHLIRENLIKPDHLEDFFEWLKNETMRRLEQSESRPTIVVIIEELSDLMIWDRAKTEEYIERLCLFSKQVGIYIVASSSRIAPDKILTSEILTCFPERVIFKISSEADQLPAINGVGADKFTEPGECLIVNTAEFTREQVGMPYISEDGIKEKLENLK